MTRVLFVDDEPRILEGLRRSLRGKRKVWEMVFAEGSAAALVELERGGFDAVVSDMRMPGMDGAELLERVRLTQPDALRIVLSGHMEESSAARAARSAHRFLAKPCDSETLEGTLSRALELRARLNSDSMRKCLGGMAGLPSLPAACVALNRALENEGVSLHEVTRIIESDVGMSTKVLQLVNSAFFGLSRRLTGVEHAVRHLGLNAVRSLVLAQALFDELVGDDVELLALEQARSLLAARYSRRFPLERRQSELAATAAMLHNVGRLALLTRGRPALDVMPEMLARIRCCTDHVESEPCCITHADVGAYLLDLWGLPPEVRDAVGTHREPLEGRGRLDASAVVHIVAVLADEAVGQTPMTPLPGCVAALASWGISEIVQVIRAEMATDPSRAVGAS